MPIIKAFVTPHGDCILDPKKVPAYEIPNQVLHNSMIKITQEFQDSKPDLVFFITPHGHALTKSHCIYLNDLGFGTVNPPSGQKTDEDDYKVNVNIDHDTSDQLLKQLIQKGYEVEGIYSYGQTYNQPLAWGEVVPLWFIQKYQNFNSFLCIFFSVSDRRHTQADQMVKEMTEIGAHVFQFLNTLIKRVVVIISCDLAHTHQILYGPDKGQEPYGYNKEAEPFDKDIEAWAKSPNTEEGQQNLLVNARNIVMVALSCGYCGLVALNGMIQIFILMGKIEQEKCKKYNILQNIVISHVYAVLHPTYFGMMVASFEFQQIIDKIDQSQQNNQLITK